MKNLRSTNSADAFFCETTQIVYIDLHYTTCQHTIDNDLCYQYEQTSERGMLKKETGKDQRMFNEYSNIDLLRTLLMSNTTC